MLVYSVVYVDKDDWRSPRHFLIIVSTPDCPILFLFLIHEGRRGVMYNDDDDCLR